MSVTSRSMELDASDLQSEHDFYAALAIRLGSPAWHGMNADAFLETMIYLTDVNQEQPPYRLLIRRPSEQLNPFLEKFAGWIAEARQDRIADSKWGDDVGVEILLV
ncbi:MAG: barstar family protein [Pseudomonadota bacterium]